MKVIYLHGFASSGNSSKSLWLQEHLSGGGYLFLSPDLPNRPSEAARFLDSFLKNFVNDDVCLIGTSLGGFFAAYYSAHLNAPAVLINPLAEVEDLAATAIGEHVNYATGEPFEVDEEDVERLRTMSTQMQPSRAPTLLLLDKGDEELDYRKAVARYGEDANVHLFEGGSHRFEHLPEALPEILTLLK